MRCEFWFVLGLIYCIDAYDASSLVDRLWLAGNAVAWLLEGAIVEWEGCAAAELMAGLLRMCLVVTGWWASADYVMYKLSNSLVCSMYIVKSIKN